MKLIEALDVFVDIDVALSVVALSDPPLEPASVMPATSAAIDW
jgi:hypothetical protein